VALLAFAVAAAFQARPTLPKPLAALPTREALEAACDTERAAYNIPDTKRKRSFVFWGLFLGGLFAPVLAFLSISRPGTHLTTHARNRGLEVKPATADG